MKNTAIILAGGLGKRMNKSKSKQLLKIKKKYVIEICLEVFEKTKEIDEIILVVNEKEIKKMKEIVLKNKFNKTKSIVIGGEQRQQSVFNGLKRLSKSCENVLIHDSARPFIKSMHIVKVINELKNNKSITLGIPCKNTIKICNEENIVEKTLNRDFLFEIQTPQGFKKEILIKSHKKAIENNFLGTDDATLVENIGVKTKIIEGCYTNIKITTKEDLIIGKLIYDNFLKEINEDIIKEPIEEQLVSKIDKDKTNESEEIENIEIYTDGACSGNPGKGGYGVLLKFNSKEKELSEGFRLTTNNRMELLAVIEGLKSLKRKCNIELYTDSKYVSDAINKGWLKTWERKNFKRKTGPVLNIDLWKQLIPLLEKHNVNFNWVKGHNNNIGNERCDVLAVEGSKKKKLKKDINYEIMKTSK